MSGSPGDAANGATRADEPHAGGLGGKLNWLGAGVLGANDGIVSVAGLVVGVAGATAERAPIFTARSRRARRRGGLDGARRVHLGQQPARHRDGAAVGAILPVAAILLPPPAWRVPVTVAAVLLALGLAGVLSARIGDTSPRRAVLRVVVGGAAGLAITYLVGRLFGAAVA